jgi:hypothetical protein
MEIISFHKLFQRHGGYSLPVLVELKNPSWGSRYFTNHREDIQWGDHVYEAIPMSYKPPSSSGGIPSGGSLELSIGEGDLLYWLDRADEATEVIVSAIMTERDGEVFEITLIGQNVHKFGSLAWDGEKITWNLGEDDRLEMQINPWVLDSDALTG